MVETVKGYMSDDGVEFSSYLECQVHEEYVKRGLISYGHDPYDYYPKPSESCRYFYDIHDFDLNWRFV